jgi:hypothetical protein
VAAGDVLLRRCESLMRQLGTTLQEDAALLGVTGAPGPACVPQSVYAPATRALGGGGCSPARLAPICVEVLRKIQDPHCDVVPGRVSSS